jgi:4-hydroxy-tetrahydrodipicolinate synthase
VGAVSMATTKSSTRGLPSGIIPALTTPLTADGRLDEAGLEAVIERAVADGVDGLLVLGSSGEVAALDAETRRRTVDVALRASDERVPVVAGVVGTDISATRAAIRDLAGAGIDAVLVAPPAYGPLSQDGLIRFYESVVPERIPMLGYHIPAFTGSRIEPATAALLARSGCLAGIKDSNRDLEYLQQVVMAGADAPGQWNVYVGTDSLILPALLLGADGAITLAAGIAPRWPVELVRHYREGRMPEAVRAQEMLTRLILALRKGAFPAGAKAALELQGVAGRTLAGPREALSDAEVHALREELVGLGVPSVAEQESK